MRDANITIKRDGAESSICIARRVEVEAIERITHFYRATSRAERTALYWFRVASAPHAFEGEQRRPKRRLSGGALDRYMRKQTQMRDTEWQVALHSVGRALVML